MNSRPTMTRLTAVTTGMAIANPVTGSVGRRVWAGAMSAGGADGDAGAAGGDASGVGGDAGAPVVSGSGVLTASADMTWAATAAETRLLARSRPSQAKSP